MSEILCIIDGMTDPAFQPGALPNLAKMRCAGRLNTVGEGKAESLNCILHLLGVSQIPANLRAYAEALAEDIPLAEDDLILRGSWYALDEDGRCRRPIAGAPTLLDDLGRYRYYNLEQYKAILVFPGQAKFVDKIVTHPPYGEMGEPAEAYRPQGYPLLAACFNAWLQKDRCLIPWGQSVYAELPPFPQKSAAVCQAAVVKGIAKMLKMDLLKIPGATADIDTDLPAKLRATLTAAETYPFVLLHINGADEAAHRRNPAEKAAFLQRVDELVLAPLLQSGHKIKVVSDHGTDPLSGQHIGALQPYYVNC